MMSIQAESNELEFYQPAPLWRRLAAMIYDSFILSAVLLIVGFCNLGILLLIYGEHQLKIMTEQGFTLGTLPFYVSLLLVIYGFFCYFWVRSGQTLGMRAWRVKVVDNLGGLPTPLQCIIRLTSGFISISVIGLGLVWVLFDDQQRSWQDICSSTLTVIIPE